ncbi:MAG: hypothetical protein OEY11_09185 [Gammaproteobacteria bacterium]|nr:hypothetical protein [Gammaproteobacteria bacterium]
MLILKKIFFFVVLGILFSISLSVLAKETSSPVASLEDKNLALQQSLKHYLNRYAENKNDPRLIYNLGVIYYKLEEYALANDFFSKLLSVDAYHLLAKYNLGLVANKAGDQKNAIYWFENINAHAHPLQSSDNTADKIKQLANVQLEKLSLKTAGNNQSQKKSNSFKSYFFAFYGYDDSVVDPQGIASNGDEFSKFYALLTLKLESLMPGLESRLHYYLKDYRYIHDYDFSQTGVDFSKYFKIEKWQYFARLAFEASTYGALHYQSVSRLDLQSRFTYLSHRYSARYRHDQLIAEHVSFEPYEGNRQRLDLGYELSVKPDQFKLTLGFEQNDRLNFTDPNSANISNYSPQRQTIQLTWTHRFNQRWESRLKYLYRDSHYDNLNTTAGTVRDDKLESSSFRLKYRIQQNCWLVSDYAYLNNQTNIAIYRYSRNILSLGISASF